MVTKGGGRREGRVKSIAVRRAKPNWNYMRAVNIGGKIHEWNIECVIFREFRTVYPYLSFGCGAASRIHKFNDSSNSTNHVYSISPAYLLSLKM